ncbi:MAG: coproporphyrinogen-III oxidase family protein [Candidatus Thermoplasmatota archaeon]|nr:coproporphyrinogen-III oxidase family protein [Candidatus Thermoplasmatota archaeon]
MLRSALRQGLKRLLTGSPSLHLHPEPPRLANLEVDSLGLYLHVPFCRRPCYYCPYFKERFDPGQALAYRDAVLREIEGYAPRLADATVTSLYIGGGTPTTMLGHGLEDIVQSLHQAFSLRGPLCTETHPTDVTPAAVERLHRLGITRVSMGVESLDDHHLRLLGRPYDSAAARRAITALVEGGFDCVNMDLMFGLPGQRIDHVQRDIRAALDLGVTQISAYPIFTFPHTRLQEVARRRGLHIPGIALRRRMLRVIEDACYQAGLRRTSVWAFTAPGTPKYSSVTIPDYLGLGAGAGSLLPGHFFINTFSVRDYLSALAEGRSPVALSLPLTPEEERMHWLYWRIYETSVSRSAFRNRFGGELDEKYGWIIRLLSLLGLLSDNGETLTMTDRGSYWVHVLQNLFALDFIGRVWGVCPQDPWPPRVELR